VLPGSASADEGRAPANRSGAGQRALGVTGPKLLTELQPIFAPDLPIAPRQSTYAVGPDEFEKFLLPEARDEVDARTVNSTFIHLWNEMWRRAGVPKNIAPPRGGWLDRMFERHQIPVVWSDRLDVTARVRKQFKPQADRSLDASGKSAA